MNSASFSKQTRASLEEALNLSSDSVLVYEAVRDEKGSITDYRLFAFNDTAAELFDFRRDQAEAGSVKALWPDIGQEKIWLQFSEVVEKRKHVYTQWRREAAPGKTMWLDLCLKPWHDGLAISCRDISELKTRQQESQKKLELYELLLTQSANRKAILSPVYGDQNELIDFRYDYVHYGKDIDRHRHLPFYDTDIVGNLVTELVPLARETPLWNFYLDIFITGRPAHTELWFQVDGEEEAVDVAGKRLEDGRLLMTYSDVSKAHQLTVALEAEKARLDAVFEAAPLGLTVFEAVRDKHRILRDLRLVKRNEKALLLSRISPEIYYPGALLSELMPSELKDHFERMLHVVRSGEPLVHELYQPHLDIWISSRVVKHGDGLLSTIQDITALKRPAVLIQQQAALLDGVLEASPNAIAVYEAMRDEHHQVFDFKPVAVNEQALGLAGTDRKGFMGVPLFERAPEYRDIMPDMLRTIEARHTHQSEVLTHETQRWVVSTLTPLGDGFVATMQDITRQKEQQVYILDQAKMLEGVLQASPHAILVFEAMREGRGAPKDFRIIRFNQQAITAMGVSAEVLERTTLFTCMPVMRSRLQQYIEVITSGTPQTYEFYDEQTGLWRRITNTPLGEGFVMTMENITGQKQITQKIEESAQLLNAVLNTSPIAIVVYEAVRDKDGVITDFWPIIANELAIRLSGFPEKEFLTTSFFQRSLESRVIRLSELSQVVNEREAEHFEHEVKASGSWVHSVATPFRDGFIASSQDVTSQKKQSLIIEEQATLFNGVLSSLQNGLAIYRMIRDDDGALADLEYIQVADILERDTGLKREDLVGQTIRTIYPGIENTEYWRGYSAVAETGLPQSFETHFTLPGYDNYLINWVTPLGEDKIVSVYYIINDLKRAQRELEHTVSELRRSNDDLEQFASVASHDLQEPLRKVQSFGNMLEQRYAKDLGSDGKDLVQRMQNAVGRMRDLVTGLLDFASLSSGSSVEEIPVDIDLLIHELITELDDSLHEAGGRIVVEGKLPFAPGIPGQLRHLFHNIFTNAIKFRKADVPPLIIVQVVKPQKEDMVHLPPSASPEHFIRIDISDNGIGFDPLYAERIFSLFERLHGISDYKGTGIGLSICRRVVERHGGAIRAKGRPGEGAVFMVLLKKANESDLRLPME